MNSQGVGVQPGGITSNDIDGQEMALWIKYLPHNPKDLRSDP